VGQQASVLSRQGYWDADVAKFAKEAVFATLTNTNFDALNLVDKIMTADRVRQELNQVASDLEAHSRAPGSLSAAAALPEPPLPWFDAAPHPYALDVRSLVGDRPALGDVLALGSRVGLDHRRHEMQSRGLDTLLGLHEMLTYALKGICAYAHHAETLGYTSREVDAFVFEALGFLASSESRDTDKVLAMALRLGAVNLEAMELLDRANTETYGAPVPTPVRLTPVKGKAILVSGHDLRDLQELLAQTEGTGINVYTHGEMLPAHGYPGLKRYPHLVGNYGGAWYRQKSEFSAFPGAILMTTNCVLLPGKEYQGRLFTTGNMVAVPGVHHVVDRREGRAKDFSQVIARALELPGFPETEEPARTANVGFGHETVLGAAGTVLDAVGRGDLKHIFLVGGCDGRQPERKYYTDIVDSLPPETLVLTLGCGKYRFFDHDLGTLPGTELPRLLDMGQCNDAYSAIVVAKALADALGTDVNGLPLSLDISWFEQKAVAILLSLLHLGVRDIRLGPDLPAFLTPDAVALLVDKWALKVPDLRHPHDDIRHMMGQPAPRFPRRID